MFGNKAIHEIYKRLDVHKERLNRIDEKIKGRLKTADDLISDPGGRLKSIEARIRRLERRPWWKFWS